MGGRGAGGRGQVGDKLRPEYLILYFLLSILYLYTLQSAIGFASELHRNCIGIAQQPWYPVQPWCKAGAGKGCFRPQTMAWSTGNLRGCCEFELKLKTGN